MDVHFRGHELDYEIRWEKLKPTYSRAQIEVPEFITQREGKYFHFPKAEVGIDVREFNGKIMFHQPYVLNLPFHHPFVWDNGEILSYPLYGGQSYDYNKDKMVWKWHDKTDSDTEKLNFLFLCVIDRIESLDYTNHWEDVNPRTYPKEYIPPKKIHKKKYKNIRIIGRRTL
jgi:hypothetical protein